MKPSLIPTIPSLGVVMSQKLQTELAYAADALSRRVDTSAGVKATEVATINTELQAAFDQTKNWLTARYTAPTVTALSDASGPAAGGEVITLTGTNFLSVHSVVFEDTPAPDFWIISNTSMTVKVPARAAGVANVRVTNAVAQSAEAVGNEYTYS